MGSQILVVKEIRAAQTLEFYCVTCDSFLLSPAKMCEN